MEISMTYSACG